MASIFNKGSKKKPVYYIIYDDIDEFGERDRKWISMVDYFVKTIF
ncbi:hypothetical protein [Candidatus Formimonas warabiya]|nr:hypothetical protein [Candidatus Formimonas warabiya]